MFAPFGFVSAFVRAEGRMVFEARKNFAQELFVVSVARLDTRCFAEVEPAVKAVARGGVFEFLFLINARIGPRLLGAEADEGRAGVGKFGECVFATGSFSVGWRRGGEADD